MLLRGCSINSSVRGFVADGRCAAMELHGCDVTAGLNPVDSREGALMLLRQTHLLVWVPRGAGLPDDSSIAQACLTCLDAESGWSGSAVQLERCTLRSPKRQQCGIAVKSSAASALLLCKVACGGCAVSFGERGRAATVSHSSMQSTHGTACSTEQSEHTLHVIGGRLDGGSVP